MKLSFYGEILAEFKGLFFEELRGDFLPEFTGGDFLPDFKGGDLDF